MKQFKPQPAPISERQQNKGEELERLVQAHSVSQNSTGPSNYPQAYNEFRPSEPTLIKMLNLLRQHRMRLEAQDERANAKRQWKYVSAVVDRLCLTIFTIIFLTSTIATIFRRS